LPAYGLAPRTSPGIVLADVCSPRSALRAVWRALFVARHLPAYFGCSLSAVAGAYGDGLRVLLADGWWPVANIRMGWCCCAFSPRHFAARGICLTNLARQSGLCLFLTYCHRMRRFDGLRLRAVSLSFLRHATHVSGGAIIALDIWNVVSLLIRTVGVVICLTPTYLLAVPSAPLCLPACSPAAAGRLPAVRVFSSLYVTLYLSFCLLRHILLWYLLCDIYIW